MREELDRELVQNYPILYTQRSWSAQQTCMCWGFPGDGWFDIINDLSQKLEFINNMKLGFQIQAVQVKEKFGTLRYYWAMVTDEDETYENVNMDLLPAGRFVKSGVEDMPDDQAAEFRKMWFEIVWDLTTLAERNSSYICEDCGERGRIRDDIGWIRTLCDKDYEAVKERKSGK